ncbi:phage baseplate assembly protein V [Luteimonas soli]|uniref:Phage baseplate assembly protein V n=1 Tax=Luteimonas soli TaxID=1648966 RepID=A0ABV7XP50_9GAMM
MSGLATVQRRVGLIVSRAIIKLVNDAAKLQGVQVVLLDGEARAEVERFQQYGFTSVPLADCEAIALAVGGSRSHMVVVATDDRRYRRVDLKPGETCIYNQHGDRVHVREDGTIDVVASSKVYVDAPETKCTGNLHVQGDITCDGDVSDHSGSMQEMRDTYNAHTHPGVQSGAGSTQAPAQEMS